MAKRTGKRRERAVLPTGQPTLTAFEVSLSVPIEDLEIYFHGIPDVPWSEFILNPRRLRGSDFLMRWSQGKWSEHRILAALERSGAFFGIPYGPSSTAPENDLQAFERYFLELEEAGLGKIKRPDILVFPGTERGAVDRLVKQVGGIERLPFTHEDSNHMRELLKRAILALESENSLWVVKQMPDYAKPLSPQKRLGGRMGLPKAAVTPTIIIKEEDRQPLRTWQRSNEVPIHVWHMFYDAGYGIAFDDAERLISEGAIEPIEQVFQAPNGVTTTKTTYRIYHHHGYRVGESETEAQFAADRIVDKNGHVLPFVRFEGGSMKLSQEALEALRKAARHQ